MERWSEFETECLYEMRERLEDVLCVRRQLPDVVGDRRMLRFLRGHGHNVEKASQMFRNFLSWRDSYNVDEIRDDILYRPINSPFQFPFGEKIIGFIPQLIIAHDACDYEGNPISLEQFNFVPDKVLKAVPKDEYIRFMVYMLEYKVLVLEQMSDLKEKEYLASCLGGIPPPGAEPYGVILSCCIIRDFGGFGMGHVGTDGRTVITWILEVGVCV